MALGCFGGGLLRLIVGEVATGGVGLDADGVALSIALAETVRGSNSEYEAASPGGGRTGGGEFISVFAWAVSISVLASAGSTSVVFLEDTLGGNEGRGALGSSINVLPRAFSCSIAPAG